MEIDIFLICIEAKVSRVFLKLDWSGYMYAYLKISWGISDMLKIVENSCLFLYADDTLYTYGENSETSNA